MKSQSKELRIDRNCNRRRFLQLAGLGTASMITGGLWPGLNQFAEGQNSKTASSPDLDISLTARLGEVSIFPGEATRVWRYSASLHKGSADRIVNIPGSYLGPIIKVRQGEKIRIRFKNEISEPSIVHWHGLHVPSIMDGHPRDVVPEGESYFYEFVVNNRAGTYWYHPHPHERTGPQVYSGLAGLFLVSDDEERALALPRDENDISLVLQDRMFDADNQLAYLSGHPMDQMTGFLGDKIMVNGLPDFTMPVATAAYRLRLLNGSNSRIYKIAWKDGHPLTIIGTDGGLLGAPVTKSYAFLSPGERLELWEDFSDLPLGHSTALSSLPFDAGTMGGGRMGRGMGMGRMRGRQWPLPNGADLTIFNLKVTKAVRNRLPLPEKLSVIEPIQQDKAVNLLQPRQFFLTMQHMQWSINGRVFEMQAVAEDEIVRLGTSEIWEFHNVGGGMMHMMNMPHPIHLHGKQFRVLGRSGVTHNGYIDDGWKDTVLLMPGERIRILVDFDMHPGMFLYHCHNLEHEDMGMMRNYFVQES